MNKKKTTMTYDVNGKPDPALEQAQKLVSVKPINLSKSAFVYNWISNREINN